MTILETYRIRTLPNGKAKHSIRRYYLNGKRITDSYYNQLTEGKQGSCFVTKTTKCKDNTILVRQWKVI
jgi:hypothetical protein